MNPLIFTAAPTLDPTPTPPEPRPSQLLPGWLAIVISGLLGWLGPLTLAIALGPPNPYVTDEFSYLLAADTFAYGRLTNPPIPDEIAPFFEAHHILIQPTRMSKYPPGQGLVLALGQVVFGHPAHGVFLSFGLFAAALCWMLLGWVRPGVALVVVGVMLFQISVVNLENPPAMSFSYWGTAVAAIGGTLLLGGLKRAWQGLSLSAGLAIGAGLVLLANSRPSEGLATSLVVAGSLILLVFRMILRQQWVHLTVLLVTVTVIVGLGGIWLAVYNHAVTGDWKTMPYFVHQKQYFKDPILIFQPDNTPSRLKFLANDQLIQLYTQSYRSKDDVKNISFLLRKYIHLFKGVSFFYLGWFGIGVILWALPKLVHESWFWVVFTIFSVVCAWSVMQTWSFMHYFAPALGALYLALGLSLSVTFDQLGQKVTPRIRRVWNRPGWQALALAAPILVLGGIIATETASRKIQTKLEAKQQATVNLSTKHGVDLKLSSIEGNHLVFYRPMPPEDILWVYNPADLDSARIIWAWDLGDIRNLDLIQRYPNRRIWKVTGRGFRQPMDLREWDPSNVKPVKITTP